MACACGSNDRTSKEDDQYVVRAPDGTTKVVTGLTAAKIEATVSGGTFTRK